MGNSSSAPRVTAQDKAILQVKIQKDKLAKYQRKMQLLITNERNQIIVYLNNGQKESAKTLLKRSKYQEKLLEDVSTQMFNLENMIHNIEFKLIEQDFLKGLKNGNSILAKLNSEMKVEDVERLVDEVHDNIVYQEEINEALAGAVVGQDWEDDIDEELEALAAKSSDKATMQDLDVHNLPSTEGLAPIKPVEEKKQQQRTQETRTLQLA